MTWHLKNRNIEQALITLCPEFLEALNKAAEVSVGYTNYVPVTLFREDPNGEIKESTLFFWINEIEDVEKYNPYGWNKWPGTVPPVKKKMRIDCFDEKHTLVHSCCGYWTGNFWMAWNGYELNDAETINFRPWED